MKELCFSDTRLDNSLDHVKKHEYNMLSCDPSQILRFFKCNECQKTFKTKAVLKIHMRTHVNIYI